MTIATLTLKMNYLLFSTIGSAKPSSYGHPPHNCRSCSFIIGGTPYFRTWPVVKVFFVAVQKICGNKSRRNKSRGNKDQFVEIRVVEIRVAEIRIVEIRIVEIRNNSWKE